MADPASEFHFSPRPNRAHDIRWRPWSAEAFAEAKREDRPILLSISAVWCHWCHVMDETTYSNDQVISLLNRDYIPVRVDNDVRPDINQRYNMGGWPTTAFLTPEGDILTGATYLPPDQMADALQRIGQFYALHRPEIASRVLEGRKRAGLTLASQVGSLDPGLVDRLLGAVEGAYDAVHGGFGSAPKFPQTDAVLLLAEQAALRRESRLLGMARHTLEQMARGGTYDHVEGGFFRYSTTADWSVPHFEKMLEDHAGLVTALAVTDLPSILDTTTRYLDSVLRDADSGLYAGSQDADERYYSLDADGRRTMEPPYVDRRVYTGWNCALAVAYLEADVRLRRPQLREEAKRLLEQIFATRWSTEHGLEHVDGVSGQLGDQAWGLIAAARAAAAGVGGGWLERARSLAGLLDLRFRDQRHGGYFDTADVETLGRLEDRVKPLAENCVIAMALLELDTLTGDPSSDYRESGRSALESVAGVARQYGILGAVFARALDRYLRAPVKVSTANRELAQAALASNPYCVIELSGDAERAVVCIGTECLAPVSSADAVADAVHAKPTPVG